MSGLFLCIHTGKSYDAFAEFKALRLAGVSLIINSLYSAGYIFLCIHTGSYWFALPGCYYLLLSLMRFTAVFYNYRHSRNKSHLEENTVVKINGILLICLSFILAGTVYMTVASDVSKAIHEIITITIATFSFTKITLAIINFVKSKKSESPVITAIRSISLSDAAASIFSLQRTMVVSFPGMTQRDIMILNIFTGTLVFITALVSGILLLIKNKKNG